MARDNLNLDEMEASRELDWLIAQRAGWSAQRDGRFYSLFNPAGERTSVGADTEANAKMMAPRYSRDVNAALTLIEGESRVTLTKGVGENWIVVVGDSDIVAPGLALAICRAWLKWREK